MATALLASRALVAATRLAALPAARRATNNYSPDGRFARSAAGFASADAPPAPARGVPRRGGGGRGGRRGRGGRGASRSSDVAQVKRRPRQFNDAQRASVDALQALADAHAAPLCVLAKGKANLFLDGAPIVYGGAVEAVVGDPQLADAVIVVDHANAVVGWGTYNPHSMYRVRVLEMAWEVEVVPAKTVGKKPAVRCDVGAVVARRVREAFELRRDILGLVASANISSATGATSTYRLVNAEGDRLSGACVDVYRDCETRVSYAAVSSSSAWTQRYRDEIVRALGTEARVDVVVWRVDEKMLALETGTANWKASERSEEEADEAGAGAADADADAAAAAAAAASLDEYATKVFDAKTGALTTLPTGGDPLVVLEHGVKYEVDLALGHKTGFYVDQRENRLSMRAWAAGKNKVLDVCTYTGGFAINAALAGATEVVGVDSSQPALDIATRNAERNGVSSNCRFVKAEAFKHLECLIETPGEVGSYDVIVLDPPKLAPSAKSLARALPKYVGLNKRAMRLLKPGGLLVTCSCSGAVTQNGLLADVVIAAAASAGTAVTALGAPRGAGADQPLDPGYPEGNYLTVLAYRVA